MQSWENCCFFPKTALYVPEIEIIASTAWYKGGHSCKALITIYLTHSKSYGNISIVDVLIITYYFSNLSILIHVFDMFISRKSNTSYIQLHVTV